MSLYWADSESKTDINGYKTFEFCRQFQHDKAKRISGERLQFTLKTRNITTDGVTIVRNRHDTIIWLKLDADFFPFRDDFTCVWEENSPAYNVVIVDNFGLFVNLMTRVSSVGWEILTGVLVEKLITLF